MAMDYGPGLSESESGKPVKKVEVEDPVEEVVTPYLEDSTTESEPEDWEDKQTETEEDWEEKDEDTEEEEDEEEDEEPIPSSAPYISWPGGIVSAILLLLIVLIMVAITSIVITNVLTIAGLDDGPFSSISVSLIDLIFSIIILVTIIAIIPTVFGRGFDL